MRRVIIILTFLSAGITAIAVGPGAHTMLSWSKPADQVEQLTPTIDLQQGMNVLIAGVTPVYTGHATKAPEDYSGLTDTIMLAHIGPDGAQVLSIPRDTWVEVPGHGFHKINAANTKGGKESLSQSVEALTGLTIDRVVLVNLSAVRESVDALGGVNINVAQDMVYHDTAGGLHVDLKAGPQRLSGQQAEGYLRWRSDGMGDIGRGERQRAFMEAVKAQLSDPGEWLKVPAVIQAAGRNVNSELSVPELITVARYALARPVELNVLPGAFGPGGTWTPDKGEIQTLIASWKAPRDEPEIQAEAPASSQADDGSAPDSSAPDSSAPDSSAPDNRSVASAPSFRSNAEKTDLEATEAGQIDVRDNEIVTQNAEESSQHKAAPTDATIPERQAAPEAAAPAAGAPAAAPAPVATAAPAQEASVQSRTVDVLNEGAPPGSARRMADRLRALGYTIGEVRNGEGVRARSGVSGPLSAELEQATRIGRYGTESSHNQVVLGQDWRG